MTSHSLSEVGDILLALQNNSSSGAALYVPYEGSNVEDITRILCTTRPKAQAQGESYRRATTVDTLPEDALLEIFYWYQTDDNFWPPLIPASCRWLKLVQVCRRWWQLVFGSPLHLDLQLLCTHRTPVRNNLGSWPPFPLVIEYGHHQRLTSYDEDNLFAALEHLERICHVNLSLPSSQLSKVATKMQESFPALKHLALRSEDKNALVFPDGFLGGAAPCLQRIALGGIIFPTIPTLLSSSSNLVDVKLYDIPRDGYISPEAMVAYLTTLPRLETFHIGFQSATRRPDRRRTPPETRTVLPSLTSIEFRGASEYLEELVSQIDSPQLNQIHISYLNQLADFQVAQSFKFIDRSEGPEPTLLKYADVTFTNRSVSLDLYQRPPHLLNRVPVRTSILCQGIDWQVSHIAQVLSHRSTFLSRVIDLKLEFGADEDCRLESVDNAEWLHLLRQFSVVRTLYVSRELAGHVALALEGVTREMAAEVLPALNLIFLEGQLASSIDKFVAICQLSGCPVTISNSVSYSSPPLDASVLTWKLWHFLAGRRLSAQEGLGDQRLDSAHELARDNETLINPSDLDVVRQRIIYTTEIKAGLEPKRGLQRYLQAREYRKSAKETLKFVKTVSDRARDALLGQSSAVAVPHPTSGQRPTISNSVSYSGPPLDATGVSISNFLAGRRPSAQEERGDQRLDSAHELARGNEMLISPGDLEIVRERITLTTEIKAGLESKRGLQRYLQAREYRKSAKETLKFVKTVSDRARDALLGQSSAVAVPHPTSGQHPTISNSVSYSDPPLDATGVLTLKLLHFLADRRPSAQEEWGDQQLDSARELARGNETLISPGDLEIVRERIALTAEIKRAQRYNSYWHELGSS